MRRRRVFPAKAAALLMCFVMLAALLCSCRDKSGGKTINWLLSDTPINLDPQTASQSSELLVIKNCFSGLFQKGEDGELFSDMLDSFDVSPGGTRYVFHLNKESEWIIAEKGEAKKYAPVTSADYAFAIKRVFTDSPNADVMAVLSDLRGADKAVAGNFSALGVYCDDDYTLRVELSKKNPALTEAFTNPSLFPCNEKFFKSTGGKYGLSADTLIYNGSFFVGGWNDSRIRLDSNTHYAGSQAIPDSVMLYMPSDKRDGTLLLKDGDIDASELKGEQFSLLDASRFTAQRLVSSVWVMIFNPASDIWKNSALRSAVIKCTDKTVFGSDSQSDIFPANRLAPESSLILSDNYCSLTKTVSAPEYDSVGAKALYSEALTDSGLDTLYNAGILIPDIAFCRDGFSSLNQIYQRELSLYFSPSYLSEQEIIKRVKSGDFTAAVIPLSLKGGTPSSVLGYFDGDTPSCVFSVTDAAFTDPFSKALRENDSATAAAENYGAAEQALFDLSLVNPLFFENSCFVTAKNVSGFFRDVSGTVFFSSVEKK